MLDAELTWGIRHPLVQENVVAQYGMVNVYLSKHATALTRGSIQSTRSAT